MGLPQTKETRWLLTLVLQTQLLAGLVPWRCSTLLGYFFLKSLSLSLNGPRAGEGSMWSCVCQSALVVAGGGWAAFFHVPFLKAGWLWATPPLAGQGRGLHSWH